MPRTTRKPAPETEPVDDARDYVMARLAAARSSAQSVVQSIDDILVLFVNPDDDKTGKQRTELLDVALEDAGVLCRALESAEEEFGDVDMKACEPWEEDSDE